MIDREEFLIDILIGAIEGGVNYWADIMGYEPDDCTATILDYETGTIYSITPESIEEGLRLIIIDKAIPLREDIYKAIIVANVTNDASGIDAEIADCIIQAGCMGEVIYG